MPQPLFLEERRSYILDSLQRMGRVSVKDLSDHLGVSAVTIRQDLQALEEEGLLDEDIERLIQERIQARKDRNFQRSDEIRDQLKSMNIILEDTAQGTRWKRG